MAVILRTVCPLSSTYGIEPVNDPETDRGIMRPVTGRRRQALRLPVQATRAPRAKDDEMAD